MSQAHLHVLNQWHTVAGDGHKVQGKKNWVGESPSSCNGPHWAMTKLSVHQVDRERLKYNGLTTHSLAGHFQLFEVVRREMHLGVEFGEHIFGQSLHITIAPMNQLRDINGHGMCQVGTQTSDFTLHRANRVHVAAHLRDAR